MNRIRVNLDRRLSASYDIHIGRGILDRMALILAKGNWAGRWFVVTDETVAGLHGGRVLAALTGAGLKAECLTIPPGEGAKTVATCLGLAETLLEKGADRASGLIALGGGVTGDITGFLASIYMRGIPCVQVPTTLLAQVDSSIGGKTGVDTEAGKNLLGTFHQPKAVFIDMAFLETLPQREFTSGLAEIVKYGIIEDPDLLATLEDNAAALQRRDTAILERLVSAACRIKKGIVEIDETEKGLRRILNFGHTVGHAVEAESGYAVSHGEAVAMGMAAAAVISERLRYLPGEDRERIEKAIERAGLPRRIPRDLDADRLLARMEKDKKKENGRIHFVLVKKPGMPFVNGGVPIEVVRETIEAIRP
jgi:3-dehydroquinate synthase